MLKILGQCMCSATEYLMALATSQKLTLQIKHEMKIGDIQYLIIDWNRFCVASEEHTDNTKEFLLLKLKIRGFWLLGDLIKGSQKFL